VNRAARSQTWHGSWQRDRHVASGNRGRDRHTPRRHHTLGPDETDALIPTHITTRGELNEWEQANIVAAAQWLVGRRLDPLADDYLRELHRRMFGRTWKWAGQFRRSNKNIGVDWPTIPVALRDMLADVRHWVEHRTYPAREIAVRFHHRLVAIHCFPNGNGRHARLCADVLLERMGEAPLDWGAELNNPSQARNRYIVALRSADRGDSGPLLKFAGVA
jgi:Fic-DOC domain mobile mystery protein B